MMSPYLAKLKQLSHRRKMHNLSLSLDQHLSQLERLDRELALARRQFYSKLNVDNAEMDEDHQADHEMEVEEELEMEADGEAEELELEGPSSDTFSSISTSTSSSSRSTTSSNSSSNSSTTNSTTTNSCNSGGDQQGQGHGPGIGFDHLKLDQTQVQVHCADEPAPGESGDCLAVKEPGIKRPEEKVAEQPLLTEVPSPLEYQDQYFPMPSLRAIKLASKSKLNAEAAVYEMPASSSLVSEPDSNVILSPSQPHFPLNVKAPVFKPSEESLDLPLSGTIAAAAAGAEATYQLLMRQMDLLHQPPDPLAHIHPLRPYPRPRRHAHRQAHPQAQRMWQAQTRMPHHHHQAQSRMHQGHFMTYPQGRSTPRRHLLPTPPPQAYQPQAHIHLHPHGHHHYRQARQSLLGMPPSSAPSQLAQQLLRSRKQPLPDLFPQVLTLMGELLRPVSYPEIVTILSARLRRPVVELKRHIPHTLHAAVIHGYMSKEGNRYSLLSEAEHMAIKRRNHEAAQRAKELEKEPLSWRKR